MATTDSIPQLYSEARPIAALDEGCIEAMFTLFNSYYENTSPESFKADLSTKNWCLLLYSEDTRELQGFTTLHFYESEFEGQPIGVVYSGDTIIDKAYWGSPTLSKSWIKTVLNVGQDYPKPLYWLLISSGYKTYRFLPLFYREFYPHYKNPTPATTQALIDRLANDRFGTEYHQEQGIVRFEHGNTPLIEGVGEVSEGRMKNPHIRYFVERNPGHLDGDELVCLTRLAEDNLTRAGERMLL